MIIHSICPLCHSDRISLYLKCTDYFLSKEEFDLFRCEACGFIFTRSCPDENDIGRYYESDDYISHDDNAKGFMNRIYMLARNFMLKEKKRIVQNATGLRTGKILDIGCGTGYFAWTMKKGGWYVTGIEPNKKASAFGSERFGIDVISPELISTLPDHSFDTVTMWHVMEHLHDPFKYSDEINRLLKPEGICIVALPNSGSSDAMYYGRFWAAYDVPRHLWHFSPSTLKIFWEKKGYEVVNIKRLPLDVFYISILSEKNRGSEIPFTKGLLIGGFFTMKSAITKSSCSSLIYFLGRSGNQ
jgi:2-polyprenyl-3-methyl-5-hydroxy-6-metoxy-1,4-benzoquinol methylase